MAKTATVDGDFILVDLDTGTVLRGNVVAVDGWRFDQDDEDETIALYAERHGKTLWVED